MQDWDEAERVRQRLAHRLHDGPIQELTAAQLFLDGLSMRMDSQQVDPQLRESLERGLAALRNATTGCRQVMDALRPGLEGEGELAERVRRLVADTAPGADVALRVDVPVAFGRQEAACALVIYRTLEDLLEQVRRGGLALRRVEVAARDGRVALQVEVGPGAAFDAESEDMAMAARRVARAGGTLELGGDGRTAHVVLPGGAGAAELP